MNIIQIIVIKFLFLVTFVIVWQTLGVFTILVVGNDVIFLPQVVSKLKENLSMQELNMAKYVLVIGTGPAGLEAAQAATMAGARVTLVSVGPLGGRAGWDSLIPSKGGK